LAGFGTRLDRPTSVRRHERLQAWSIGVMARRAERLLGLRLDLEPGVIDALTPGPVIVLCRHVNIVDASLPTLLYQRLGYGTRGVIMAELLADPGFDLIYRRTGSVFIRRASGPEAREMLQLLRHGIDASTAVVIFPEGRLFRNDLLTDLLTKLTDTNPDRAQRLAALRHVLPPRPGGVLALLDAIPHADVVVIAHAGLEPFPTFTALARAAPIHDAIKVTAWRIPAAAIPTDADDRITWLDEQWIRVDQWVHERSNFLQAHLAGTVHE
jgi:1-acyl-sn-glycerol-3-phosphate acyltransferase